MIKGHYICERKGKDIIETMTNDGSIKIDEFKMQFNKDHQSFFTKYNRTLMKLLIILKIRRTISSF